MSPFHLVDLGTVEYELAKHLQEKLVEYKMSFPTESFLLLLEHPPVFTLGKMGTRDDVLASDEQLSQEGIAIHVTPRGGQVTYHGPGQLVGYIISSIHELGEDVPTMIHNVEESIIKYLQNYHGITGQRVQGKPGVWLDKPPRKIAAIGMKLTKGLTSHGFALNIQTNPDHWNMIIACGIRDAGVTSVALETGMQSSMSEVKQQYAVVFEQVFKTELRTLSVDQLLAKLNIGSLDQLT